MKLLKCNDCNLKFSEDQIEIGLIDITDLFLRIDPGDTVPFGECPSCGALVYKIKQSHKTTHTINLPIPHDPEAPWVIYDYYDNYEDALKVAKHFFGANNDGCIDIIDKIQAKETKMLY